MKTYPQKSTLGLLAAAAVALTVTGCSGSRQIQKETQAELDASVTLPVAWHNQPGQPATAKETPAEPTSEERRKFDAQLASGAKTDRLILLAWARQFNDPVLERIINTALYTSPDLHTMLERVAEMRARAGLESANLWPTIGAYVEASESYHRNHRNYTNRGARQTHGTTHGNLYSAGFRATWEVDLFGKYQASSDAARMEEFISMDNFRAAQISLAAEIAEAYVHLRESEARKAVALRTLQTHEETQDITRQREKSGVGDTYELQQVTSSLELARSHVPTLQAEIDQARTRLAILTGAMPGSLDSLLARETAPLAPNISAADAAIASLPVAPDNLRAATPSYTIKNRPDIRAASKSAVAASLRTTSAKRQWFPTLNLSGAIGVDAMKAGNLFSPEATVGSILAGLTQPIFDGWRISNTVDITTEIQRQAMSGYQSAVLNALGEIEEAFIAIRAASQRLEDIKRATNNAADNASIAMQKKEAGIVDFVAVLDAQRKKLEFEDQVIAVAAARTTAQIRLFRALGGAELDSPQPAVETPQAK